MASTTSSAKNRGHPGIQEMAEIGNVDGALDVGRQKFLTAVEHFFGIGEFLHLDAQNRVNNGQIIGGIGEGQRLVGAILIHRLFELTIRLGNDIIGALNRGKSD